MDTIKFQFEIPEEVYNAFEMRCRSIMDQVFDEKMKAIQQERAKYTRAEAAKRLRISLPTLDKHLAGGAIKWQRLGKRILIPENELENFLNHNR